MISATTDAAAGSSYKGVSPRGHVVEVGPNEVYLVRMEDCGTSLAWCVCRVRASKNGGYTNGRHYLRLDWRKPRR